MTSRKYNESSNKDDSWSTSDEDDDNDDDEDEGDDRFTFFSICSNPANPTPPFDTLASALEHDVTTYGFDLLSHLPSSSEEGDFFEAAIVLVNKCRQYVKEWNGNDANANSEDDAMKKLGSDLHEYLTSDKGSVDLGDEEKIKYFKPVLEDDSVLMCVDELHELKRVRVGDSLETLGEKARIDNVQSKEASSYGEHALVEELKAKVFLLESQLARAKEFISSLANDEEGNSIGSCSDDEAKTTRTGTKKSSKSKPDNDTYYFSSYSNTSIHETMLRDTVRTAGYESAILSNSDALFRNKIVLDIGCGTGILSMFCAKAGAKKVIAVDNSDILVQAKENVKLNGFDDVITCVRGKIEALIETNGLPLAKGETVDVVVSEWMGYALFFETMLPSVMEARDAIMTPRTGTMYPNIAKIFLEGANDKGRLSYWENVHGLNMAPMKDRMVDELTQEAWVEIVEKDCIVTNRDEIIVFDLNTCKDEDLDFEAPFELTLRDGMASTAADDTVEIHQLVVSFDIDFAVENTTRVSFSTGCQSTPTHWKQAVLWFDVTHNCPVLNRQKLDVMRGIFRMKRNSANHRAIDMAVVWETGRNNEGSWTRTMDGSIKRSLVA